MPRVFTSLFLYMLFLPLVIFTYLGHSLQPNNNNLVCLSRAHFCVFIVLLSAVSCSMCTKNPFQLHLFAHLTLHVS